MRKVIRWCVAGILVTLALIFAGIALRDWLAYQETDQEYQSIVQEYVSEIPVAKERSLGYPELVIDYEGLLTVNPDFIGMLYVPALDILYPVAQSKDDQEYLHRTFEGKNLFSGCIFMEKESKPDLTGRNTFLFGHNMNNGSMFGSLKKFLRDPDLCDTDPWFYIYTSKQVYKYRIFAYHTTKLGGPLYRYVTSDSEYDAFLSDIRKESVYPAGAEINLSDRPKIVTLSTCYATGHVKSFVVHGALTQTFDYH